MRGGDDLVAGLHVQRGHRQIERVGAVGAGHAVLDIDRAGELAFEGVDIAAANERIVADHGGDGAVDLAFDGLILKLQVGKGTIYRHFPNKESMLVELLVGISARLLAGAREVTARSADAAGALDGLIDFHLDFAFGEPDLIRIQDRDLAHLPVAAERQVRKAQRQYVEVWVAVLRKLDPTLAEADARLSAHAVFGLLNSTPHSMKAGEKPVRASRSRAVMRAMTVAALEAGGQLR